MFRSDQYGLVARSGHHYGTPIELKNVNVSCDVTHLVSNVKTTFIYQNQFEEPVEAEFVFPLDCVSVYAFEARVQDRTVVAKCRPKAEARQTYSEAVQKGHTAILAEQDEHCEDIFQMRIGNIPTKETVTVILKYAGHLDSQNVEDDSTCRSEAIFTLPSVINPRYSPGDSAIKSEFEVLERCYSTNPSKYEFSFEADLFMPVDVVSVSSEKDTYKVDFNSSGHNCVKVKMTSSFEPNHDLQMVIKMKEKLDSFAVCEPGISSLPGILSMNCLMAEFVPDFSKVSTEQESRTEIHFVVDRSGSMDGSNIENASESLLLLLKSLPVGCRFQIIGFGNSYSKLFPEPVDYTEETLKQAIEYQRNLRADMGGTEVLPALKAAYSSLPTGEGWFKQIIFLTDGDVTNADEVVGLVASNVGRARLFAIGIGEGASTYLVSGVARAGRGVATFIRQNSQMRGAVMRILGMALQPRASSVQIEWKLHETNVGGQETPLDVITVPSVLPPAFTGHWIKAFGFVKNVDIAKIKGEVNLTCVVFDQSQSFSIQIPSSVQNRLPADAADAPLHRLAGKCQMNELCERYKGLLMSKDEGDQNPEALQLRSQIEQLSCALNIASPYTALVGVDVKQQEPILVRPDPPCP
ncbi:unnamed protein product [Calicophoron daubneyi]|uniref:Uncharacterized protein n=1 Tax=Calicophoron daubneyi TaxID=300641 RepID=A0AAV2T5F3_CALDB